MASIVAVKCMIIVMRQHNARHSWSILFRICGNVTEGNLCVVRKTCNDCNEIFLKLSYVAYDHGEYGGPNSCAARKFNQCTKSIIVCFT